MSKPTYHVGEHPRPKRKPVIWLGVEIKTPPLSDNARVESGTLLRTLQEGIAIGLPHSRPMPSIGQACHELRIHDENRTWRIVYRIDDDAILVVDVFPKTTRTTSKQDIDRCKKRLKKYDAS